MNKIKHFIGIDISKEKFDAALLSSEEKAINSCHQIFENSDSGCKAFIKWLTRFDIGPSNCLVCAEHTGMYVNILANYLASHSFNLWLEMSYRIIHSTGIQRGKSDKVDALRIAQYAEKHMDKAILYKPRKTILIKISSLLKLRDKLIKEKASLQKTVNEYKVFDKDVAILLAKHQSRTLKSIVKDIKQIELTINDLMNDDKDFLRLYQQVTSVPGVGQITALTIMCHTNEFKNFESPRQLACYCGVVPFEYTSGKSIRGKPHVHFMANKQLKQLLHMCALTACIHDPEMQTYFKRKVTEGKSKMLVINNIRNKMIHRICACVRENRKFETRLVA